MVGNRSYDLVFLQKLNCSVQFHKLVKYIKKNIDFNLLHCYELLLHILVLELSVVNSLSESHCSPVSTLGTGRCLSLATNVLTFNFFGHTIHSLDARVLYRAVPLPFSCLMYLT